MNDWKNNLRNIKPYVPGEQSKEADIVKLNANENPYPPSPQAIKALQAFDAKTLRLYPPADATPLKAALAEYYGVKVANVFLGNGSDDVLALAFQAFFNSGKPIMYPDITYSFYPVWCDLLKIPYKTVPLDADFRIHAEDYRAENGGVVLPNPNAPTSIGEGPDFIRSLMAYNRDSVVIIDEAYVDFGGVSSIPLTKEYENLLVTGTFSKSRSLAGLRIGFAIGSETLIAVLEAVKNAYNSYTVDSLSVAAGVASVKDDAYFKETIGKVIATRARVTEALRGLGFTVYDSSANFLFAAHDDYAMRELFEYLKTKRIFIRYFNLPRIDNHVRITVGTDSEMDRFLDGVRQFMEEKQP